MATTTPMIGEGWMFPAASDVLVEILTRLPPSTRRLLRLVCRLWRDVVDERTQEMRSRVALLVQNGSSSYVVDDLSLGRRRELWTGCAGERYESMFGSCGSGSDEKGGQSWSRRYSIQVHISRDEYGWRRHQLTRPQFAHGEYVLTKLCRDQSCFLYGSRVSDAGRLQCGVVRLSEKKQGTEIGTVGGYGQTFAYVKTTEPLDVYRVSDCRWIYRP
uniref:Uncharacterized protein n=1 Tax=Avena sativa TaxID=4498 RepID=A0ACD5Y716_AVESA